MSLCSIEYIFHLIGSTIIINTELVTTLSATAFVTQLTQHRNRFARSRVQFPGGWPKVAFFTTGLGWVLKYLNTRDFLTSKLSTCVLRSVVPGHTTLGHTWKPQATSDRTGLESTVLCLAWSGVLG